MLLLLAIARLGRSEPDTPVLERMVSMGAAIQNLLLTAHAMDFGTGLISGQAMRSPRLAAQCALGADESPVFCINIGSVTRHKPPARVRPAPALFFSDLPSAAVAGERSRCSMQRGRRALRQQAHDAARQCPQFPIERRLGASLRCGAGQGVHAAVGCAHTTTPCSARRAAGIGCARASPTREGAAETSRQFHDPDRGHRRSAGHGHHEDCTENLD